MNIYFLYGGIGTLVLALLIGLCTGLVRGLKRSSLHLLFFVGSVILAYFITKPITNAILGIKIAPDGTEMTISEYIVALVEQNFDLTGLASAKEFLTKLPNAIASPILFIVLISLCYFVLDIIYLIVARVAFGKKKADFQKNKPRRAYGAVIGTLEALLFTFITFAPLTSLTKTYQTICEYSAEQTQETEGSNVIILEEGTETPAEGPKKMDSVGTKIKSLLPKEVHEGILAYNKCVIGKMSGAGGFGNVLFDGLSNFEMDGEKVQFRKEVITLTSTYDDFVIVYNKIQDKDYQNIDFTNLKANVEKFVDDGLFKSLVANTVKEFVLNFNDLKIDLSSMPNIIKDYVSDLKVAFSKEDFDPAAYLKHDIIDLVDVFETVVKSNLYKDFKAIDTKKIINLLEVVDNHSADVSTALKKVFGLNLIKDGANATSKFLTEKMKEIFNSETVGVNLDSIKSEDEKNQMVTDMMSTVKKFIDLDNSIVDKNKTTDNKIGIDGILNPAEGENIMETLMKIDDVDQVLIKVGKTFDTVRNLSILNLPATSEREAIKVFDEILKIYNVQILTKDGIEYYENGTKEILDTYEKLFTKIANPVKIASDLKLLDSSKTLDDQLNEITNKLSTDEDKKLLSDLLLPFYQLDSVSFNTIEANSNLKTLVFDKIVDSLSSINMLSVNKVKTNVEALTTKQNKVEMWNSELCYLGTTLDLLGEKKMGTVENPISYLTYLRQQDADLQEAMKVMLSDKDEQNVTRLSKVLENVIKADIFDQLESDVFDKIDLSIKDVTKVKPVTDRSRLGEIAERTSAISTIESLLDITLNQNLESMKDESGEYTSQYYSTIGSLLDILNKNAKGTGDTNRGTFNNIFANLIWYMTSDNINGATYQPTDLPNENYIDIKAFIMKKTNTSVGGTVDYYAIENYKEIMLELKDTLDFANALKVFAPSGSLSDNAAAAAFASAFFEGLDGLKKKDNTSYTNAEKENYLSNLIALTNANPNHKLLSDEDKTNYNDLIYKAIDNHYNDSAKTETYNPAMSALLKTLFNLTTPTT